MIDLDIIRAGVNFVRRLGSVNLTEVEDAKVVPVVRGDVRLKEVRVCAVSSERLREECSLLDDYSYIKRSVLTSKSIGVQTLAKIVSIKRRQLRLRPNVPYFFIFNLEIFS